MSSEARMIALRVAAQRVADRLEAYAQAAQAVVDHAWPGTELTTEIQGPAIRADNYRALAGLLRDAIAESKEQSS